MNDYRALDAEDPLAPYRDRFHIPLTKKGVSCIYFCGNSLGLQPKSTAQCVMQELEDWKAMGVEGHFHARHPWLPYHEFLTKSYARLAGAKDSEVVAMNTLTVNLHLMMVSFYRPTAQRHKILIESGAFPSDRYAVESQIIFHGFDPKISLIEGDPEEMLEKHGESIALVLVGGVNYYTGRLFDMKRITAQGQEKGCYVGFDLAHAMGNVELFLHDWGVDFACWCSYKYLNAGPGSVAGCFVHERHANNPDLPRFAGWWGHDKATRFKMGPDFHPLAGAEGWQLSNPPILSLAAVRASLDIFDQAGMPALRAKSLKLTGYLESLLQKLPQDNFTIITPSDPAQRGCQLSLLIRKNGRSVHQFLEESGVVCDWREPDCIRIAPVPLYNSFSDVYHFVTLFGQAMGVSVKEAI